MKKACARWFIVSFVVARALRSGAAHARDPVSVVLLEAVDGRAVEIREELGSKNMRVANMSVPSSGCFGADARRQSRTVLDDSCVDGVRARALVRIQPGGLARGARPQGRHDGAERLVHAGAAPVASRDTDVRVAPRFRRDTGRVADPARFTR